MKKFFTLTLSFIVLAVCSRAQNYTYFTEYFDDGATAITGTTANAATTPTPATIKSGTWTTYYSFRAGAGCSPQDPAQTSPKYLRILAQNASSPTGLSTNPNGPSAYIVTPTLSYGVNQVSWQNNSISSSGGISIYTSIDDGANWTLFQTVATPVGAVACAAYSVTINNAAVNKIKFQNNSATANQELDNITITSVNPVLPVTISSVKAYVKDRGVQIEWSTTTESNISGYTIERSANAREFAALSTVASKVSTLSVNDYTWVDATPTQGVNYYRIKAVDKDGSFKYTTILSVNMTNGKTEISVAPNPVKGGQLNVQLSSLTKGSYSLKLYNNVGQLVFSSPLSTEGGSLSQSFTLPSTVKAGVYNLQVTGGDVKLNKRVVVE